MFPKLLTIVEVAAVLGVHRSTVSRLLQCGDLPYITILSAKRVLQEDLAAFIDRQKGDSGTRKGCGR